MKSNPGHCSAFHWKDSLSLLFPRGGGRSPCCGFQTCRKMHFQSTLEIILQVYFAMPHSQCIGNGLKVRYSACVKTPLMFFTSQPPRGTRPWVKLPGIEEVSSKFHTRRRNPISSKSGNVAAGMVSETTWLTLWCPWLKGSSIMLLPEPTWGRGGRGAEKRKRQIRQRQENRHDSAGAFCLARCLEE